MFKTSRLASSFIKGAQTKLLKLSLIPFMRAKSENDTENMLHTYSQLRKTL